jgi:hypothetical protein
VKRTIVASDCKIVFPPILARPDVDTYDCLPQAVKLLTRGLIFEGTRAMFAARTPRDLGRWMPVCVLSLASQFHENICPGAGLARSKTSKESIAAQTNTI